MSDTGKLTLKDWIEAQPKVRVIDALDTIWRGWCQDPKCPNNPWYGVKVGTKIKIKLPKDTTL
jgi:hypothetical protein